jgi:hypothetical protein
MSEETRGRGRPAKPSEEVKRYAMAFRTAYGLKHALDEAAAKNGRSVAQEMEERLFRSFRYEQEDQFLGGGGQAEFLRSLIGAMNAVTRHCERPWHEDYVGWNAVGAAVEELMTIFKPVVDANGATIYTPLPETEPAMKAFETEQKRVAAARADPHNADRWVDLFYKDREGTLNADERIVLDAIQADQTPKLQRPDLPPDELAKWEAARESHEQTQKAFLVALRAAGGARRWLDSKA